MNHPKKPLPIITGILLAGGFILLTLGMFLLIPAASSSNCPSTDGRITGYQTVQVYSGKTSKTAVAVTYRYEIGGNQFESNRFSHTSQAVGPPHSSEDEAVREYLQSLNFRKWRTGEKVRVFYNPEIPSDSVLQPGATWLAWGLLGIGAIIATIGIRNLWKIRHLPVSGNRRSDPSA